jgi:hypothetical protein
LSPRIAQQRFGIAQLKKVKMSVETHPFQVLPYRSTGKVPKVVAMAAYEVYCHIYGSQEAMVTGGCRGGFGAGELIAFLYARSFPKSEWVKRVGEAFDGMEVK